MLVVACGGAPEASDGEDRGTSGGEALATAPCSLRDGAVELAVALPAGAAVHANPTGCVVADGESPASSDLVVQLGLVDPDGGIDQEPDGAVQFVERRGLLGNDVERVDERSVTFLGAPTTAYLLRAPAPPGLDGPREAIAARVPVGDGFVLAIAVHRPGDAAAAARAMQLLEQTTR